MPRHRLRARENGVKNEAVAWWHRSMMDGWIANNRSRRGARIAPSLQRCKWLNGLLILRVGIDRRWAGKNFVQGDLRAVGRGDEFDVFKD
jgi:hypothetical protein